MSILKTSSTPHKESLWSGRGASILIGALLLLLALFVASLSVGAAKISLPELWDILLRRTSDTPAARVFFYVRLPRSIAAVLCGMGLSLSGTVLQTVLHNPMCSPSVIGVNAGAGLAMICVTAFFPQWAGFAPMAGFFGALLSVLLVYTAAKKTGASRLAIVLSGLAVSSLLSAMIDLVITLVPNAAMARVDFLIGSFSGVGMQQIKQVLPYLVLGAATVLLLSFDINVLALGDSAASSLGLRVSTLRGLLLIAAALLAGAAISLAGLVGFVGLIVPHMARFLVGQDHRILLPLAAILGGAFALGCDILARVLFMPFELPVGIVMSLLGAPFFLYLVLYKRRRSTVD